MHSHLSSVHYLNVVVKTISFDLERLRRHRVFQKCILLFAHRVYCAAVQAASSKSQWQ